MLYFLPQKQKGQRGDAQYSVYIYYHSDNDGDDTLWRWKKTHVTRSQKRAITYGKLLHKHKRYDRVEIQKHFFCPHEKRQIGQTIRTYQ